MTIITAVKIDAKPAHVIQLIEWNFRTLPTTAMMMVEMSGQYSVHIEWWERALRPVDMPAPVQRT